jgi:hypothetical protein
MVEPKIIILVVLMSLLLLSLRVSAAPASDD